MQENDDVQLMGVLNERGEYSEMSELNRVGPLRPGSSNTNEKEQVAKMPETELKKAMMSNLNMRTKREQRRLDQLKKQI